MMCFLPKWLARNNLPNLTSHDSVVAAVGIWVYDLAHNVLYESEGDAKAHVTFRHLDFHVVPL